MEEQILKEIEALREDVNILAQYTKDNLDTLKNLMKSIDGDLKSLESDIVKKIASSSSTSSDVTYIKELISDDFKEMQKSLIEQITIHLNKNGEK